MWAKFQSVMNTSQPPKGLHILFPLSQNFTWLWVSLREIHIAQVQALRLRFMLPADTAGEPQKLSLTWGLQIYYNSRAN